MGTRPGGQCHEAATTRCKMRAICNLYYLEAQPVMPNRPWQRAAPVPLNPMASSQVCEQPHHGASLSFRVRVGPPTVPNISALLERCCLSCVPANSDGRRYCEISILSLSLAPASIYTMTSRAAMAMSRLQAHLNRRLAGIEAFVPTVLIRQPDRQDDKIPMLSY